MILQDYLKLPEALLIGSRALGVATMKSDYDIVIPLSSIPKSLQDRLDEGKDFSIQRYFNVHPAIGKGWFFDYVYVSDTKLKIQVIVIEHHQDLFAMKQALEAIKELPKYVLENKQDRIRLFENRLVYYGWIIPKEQDYGIPY